MCCFPQSVNIFSQQRLNLFHRPARQLAAAVCGPHARGVTESAHALVREEVGGQRLAAADGVFDFALAFVAVGVRVPAAAARDVAVLAASPLHGGLLGSKRAHWRQQGRFADLFERQEQVEELLQERDLDPVDAGLRYLLTDPRVSIILSGVDSVGELERSAAVSDGRYLEDELIRRIEET